MAAGGIILYVVCKVKSKAPPEQFRRGFMVFLRPKPPTDGAAEKPRRGASLAGTGAVGANKIAAKPLRQLYCGRSAEAIPLQNGRSTKGESRFCDPVSRRPGEIPPGEGIPFSFHGWVLVDLPSRAEK